ncbi:unnamed protein product [Symbiodinium microadriaticum]|nr:unnamed protein product [Symbiodinium microadriaticum]CAE7610860.1 unnamed protein product [Symbiodinium sp. KB8]
MFPCLAGRDQRANKGEDRSQRSEAQAAATWPAFNGSKVRTCTETMRYLEEVGKGFLKPFHLVTAERQPVLHSLSLDLAELRVLVPAGQRIGEAMGQTIQASQMKEITLSTMNERYPFAISDTASKEMVIEDELKRMQDQWTKLKFQIKPDEMPTVMAEFHHEQVWELIAEQAAKAREARDFHRFDLLDTDRTRPSTPRLADDLWTCEHNLTAEALVAHDAKLKAIGELVDLLEESQFGGAAQSPLWVKKGYLAAREHMMNEGLVKDLMQRDTERNKEWKRFFDVEKQWQGTLNHLRSAHSYLELLDQKITVNCREAFAPSEFESAFVSRGL